MSQRKAVQRDFSGGEVSPKLLQREDTEAYKRSVLTMVNYMPTLQGTVMRCPGTRYLEEIGDLDARIVPYLTSGNERSLLAFTPGNVRLMRNVTERLGENVVGLGGDPGTGIITYRKKINPNPSFHQGLNDWIATPEAYTGGNGDGPLGVFMDPDLPNTVAMVPRLYDYPQEADTVTLEGSAVVDVATNGITLDYFIRYLRNPPSNVGGFIFNVVISENSDYSSPISDVTFNKADYGVGSSFVPPVSNIDLPTVAWTGTLYFKLTATATSIPERESSNPQFGVHYFNIWANGQVELTDADLATPPYAAEDLQDLHYIQSPYADKELVVTHPRHEPHKLYFNTGGGSYQFIPIVFTNGPSVWTVNNYPASCTSFNGRLILGGSQSFKTATGDPVATVSETVWGTEAGRWSTFTAAPGSNPDDSIEFNTVYRSPIQWVYGQKALLVGALEFEYSAISDAIFSPGDLGVAVQSTHGSNNVQPAGFGTGVVFPSDGGTKVRMMSYQEQEQSWVAPDLTMTNPEICFPKIVRLARMRNPHQMCVVLKSDGTLALLHSEAGLKGWSRYSIDGGQIKDICVMADENGVDVLFMTVQRNINGVRKLYLEAIADWTYAEQWDYCDSHLVFNYETPTSTITGLDHLEGKRVQVADNYRYVGSFEVVGGEVTLDDDIGGTTPMTSCIVGLQNTSKLKTLPPGKLDPATQSRFTRLVVRILASIRPTVNGYRPEDRSPEMAMNLSQQLDVVHDVEISATDWEPGNSIDIQEILPFRQELIGIFGIQEVGER